MISESEVKKIVKEKKVLYGYKQAKKALKSGKVENIIIARDRKEELLKDFENCIEFNGDSKRLGTICGKPFNVSVLTVIKEE